MTSHDDSDTLVIRRILPASRERVFAAWLDPVSLAQWMCPGSTVSAAAETDPRVGGRFRIVMRHEHASYEHSGEYLAIDPPARLSFTWTSAATDHQPTVVTIDLVERGEGTELTLIHRGLPPAKIDSHRGGWSDIVRKLGDALSRAVV